ncbi:ABC transporter permease [Caenimonas terrae]|uniref:ABC transporter permease n=1 Tax=Caenimonas terrae TaxID=696074 RepID=A0ABW0NI39_9BURK
MAGGMLRSLRRLGALLRKEFLQLLRDPRMRFVLVAPPLIELVLFGYAATFDVRHAEVAVVDHDGSQASRELVAAVRATGHYTLHFLPDMRAASAAMDDNRVRVILQIPPDLQHAQTVQLVGDGSDPNSAQLIAGELSRVISQASLVAAGALPAIRVEERAWFNPNLEDRWYFIPGILANVVFVATMMLSAMVVVREREFGTLERLLVTPVGRIEFLLAKMVPVACVGLFDTMLITLVATAWFGIPLRGELAAVAGATLVLLLGTQGLGLLASTHAATQQQAMMWAAFFIMPMIVLSGFAFPISNMPPLLQWLSWLDPLRYYLVVVRDLFLKGGGLGSHPFEYAAMALLGIGALGLALPRLR